MTYEEVLSTRTFISLATADREGQPCAVPKFLLKHEKPYIYLVDSSFGRTTANLRINPKVSACFMDFQNLDGFRIDGPAVLFEAGEEFEKLAEEVRRKVAALSADRLLEGVRTGKKSEHFELEIGDRFAVIRLKIEDVTRIRMSGSFNQE